MNDTQPVRVLILTSDAGAGHRSAAYALDGALRACFGASVMTAVVNPIHEPHAPLAFRVAEENYLTQVQVAPTLYQWQHEATDAPLPAAFFGLSARLLMARAMKRLLTIWRPDVVISTYLLFGEAVAAAGAHLRRPTPHVTVITDFGATVHTVWFSARDALCIVPSETVRRKALTCGLDAERVAVVGIPVDRRFGQISAPAGQVRQELGWNPDLPAVLLMSGGAGIGHVADLAAALDAAHLPGQLAIVAGRNEELEQRLRAYSWRGLTHIYGFTREVPALMHAADVVVTKAGGLSISEALAAGRPIILHSAIQGQETGNVEHVVSNGAGVWAPTTNEVTETLRRWLDSDAGALHRFTVAAQALGRPQAADEISRQVFAIGRQAQASSRQRRAQASATMRPLRVWARRHARRVLSPELRRQLRQRDA